MKRAALEAVIKSAERMAGTMRLNEVREFLRLALDALSFETGPENSREEVSPSGSSLQRDCPAERVTPAINPTRRYDQQTETWKWINPAL